MSTSMTSVADWVALNNRTVFAIAINAHAWRRFSPISGGTQVSHWLHHFLLHDLLKKQPASVFSTVF